jgi:hypothetical protein
VDVELEVVDVELGVPVLSDDEVQVGAVLIVLVEVKVVGHEDMVDLEVLGILALLLDVVLIVDVDGTGIFAHRASSLRTRALAISSSSMSSWIFRALAAAFCETLVF